MIEYLILAAAAFFAGMLNTVAGGGTFLTFPALVYTGVLRLPPTPPAPSRCFRGTSEVRSAFAKRSPPLTGSAS